MPPPWGYFGMGAKFEYFMTSKSYIGMFFTARYHCETLLGLRFKILPKNLKKLTPNADLGLSLEEDIGLNYRYGLPNKILDYIQATIPVIVSDLPEMKKLVESYKVGTVLYERTPESLAVKIEETINNDYSSALQKAKKELNWANEKTKLIQLLEA